MSARAKLHGSLGITAADLPISDRPIKEWTVAQIERANHLLKECRETYGVEETRKLFPEIGFPVPPAELIDPLPSEQRRH